MGQSIASTFKDYKLYDTMQCVFAILFSCLCMYNVLHWPNNVVGNIIMIVMGMVGLVFFGMKKRRALNEYTDALMRETFDQTVNKLAEGAVLKTISELAKKHAAEGCAVIEIRGLDGSVRVVNVTKR